MIVSTAGGISSEIDADLAVLKEKTEKVNSHFKNTSEAGRDFQELTHNQYDLICKMKKYMDMCNANVVK